MPKYKHQFNFFFLKFAILLLILALVNAFGQDPQSNKTLSPSPNAKSPIPTPTSKPKISERPVSSSGEIVSGYDGVLFGMVKDVFIRTEGADWATATENVQLKVKDAVRTAMGKTKMKLRGRGELRLPPNSEMILVAMDERGEKVTIELMGGRIWNNITPGGGVVNYTVKTPDLVAGVRGTLFKVSLDEGPRSRLAVFDGSVYVTSAAGGAETIIPANQSVTTDPSGRLTAPKPVLPNEINEWTEWDAWALDIHQNISSQFSVGGEQIDAMAKSIADDQKRYEKIMNEANRTIIVNKEAERLERFKEAFLKFARDTGVFPSIEMNFTALMENPGLPGWKSSYIEEKTLPLLDRWGQSLRYTLKKSAQSGNTFGEIHSNGPDKTDQNDQVGSDDIRILIPYYQLGLPE